MRARMALVIVTTAVAIACFAPGAQGAITLGSSLSAVPNDSVFCPNACSMTQMELPGRSVAAPSNGVIVLWRIRTNGPGGPFRLRVMRPVSDTTLMGGRASTVMTTAAAGVAEFGTRLRVLQGDRIALQFDSSNTAAFKGGDGVPGAIAFYYKAPSLSEGKSRPVDEVNDDTEILFNADFEPDADGDGHGDETQDVCPGITGIYAGCTRTNPVIVRSVAKRQAIKSLSAFATLDRVAAVSAQAVVKYNVGKKRFTVKSRTAATMVGAGVKTKLALKFTKSQRAELAAQLKLKKKLTTMIKFSAQDALGQKQTATSSVRLKL